MRKNKSSLDLLCQDERKKHKIDQIIKVIKSSKDVDTARKSLMTKFKLSEIQASHILDMPLRRLTALEMEKLEEEKKELKETIKDLGAILKSRAKQDKILIEELEAITEKFGDERRSRIVPAYHCSALEKTLSMIQI